MGRLVRLVVVRPWGYGHYPHGAFHNPFPPPGEMLVNHLPVRVDEIHAQAERGATYQTAPRACVEAGEAWAANQIAPNARTEAGAMGAANQSTESQFQPKKDYPNRQLGDRELDICLNYQLNVDTRAWTDLDCKSDMMTAMKHVAEKALVAWTWAVSMEIKNTVVKSKARRGPAKRGRWLLSEDIAPPGTAPEMEAQVHIVDELQDHLFGTTHSRPGMRVFCWVEPAEEGIKGGHREMSHPEITLWAKYI
ncbi:hypothetical protein EI94DRAFT_1701581 [Lactarius quietus]|nr:hypothetical protein EI94DRAFT_1701581 [Lactarius quietus]